MTCLDLLGDLIKSTDNRLELGLFLHSLQQRWPQERGVRIEILYFNQEQGFLEQIEQVGFDRTREEMRVRKVATGDYRDGMGICAYVVAKRESLLVPDIHQDPRYTPVQEEEGDTTCSELAVPLMVGNRFLGVLNLEAEVICAFDLDDLRYCEQLSPLLAVLIDYETYRIEESFLREVEASIAVLLEREAILTEFLDRVLDLIGSDCLGCMLVPTTGGEPVKHLKVTANRGLNLEEGEVRDVSTFGVIQEALAHPARERYWRRNFDGEAVYVELAPGIRSEFALVLKADDEVIALLNLESSRPTLSERYRRAIRQMARQIEVMLYSLQKKGELERQKGAREGADTILEAARGEAHTLKNLIEMLMPSLTNLQGLSETEINFAHDLMARTLGLDRTLVGFLEIGKISLKEVIETAQRQAGRFKVNLDCKGTSDVFVIGSRRGFACIFENLLLNTCKHGNGAGPPKSYISIEVNDGRGVLSYWDEGKGIDPTKFNSNTFLEEHEGQGLKIVDALCKRYEWQFLPGLHDGSLELTFQFRCLPPPEPAVLTV